MEVEVKLRLPEDAVAPLRDRLRQATSAAPVSADETDTFFSHPSRDLVEGDEAFRLRERDGRMELTYKGPRLASELKARPEYNVGVADDPHALLEALGFRPAARLRKRRETWAMDGAQVTLDHLDGLGWFVEIEADATMADPAGTVDAWRSRLELDGLEALSESYVALALAAGASAASTIS